jgi:hypothetical protein
VVPVPMRLMIVVVDVDLNLLQVNDVRILLLNNLCSSFNGVFATGANAWMDVVRVLGEV